MDNPESRHAHPPEAASEDSASPLNPHPEAAKPAGQASSEGSGAIGEGPGGSADRLDFEPVPLRYRSDGLTPERQRAYVEALADTGIAREAAARVGVSEQAISRVRRRADARSFDNACEAAHMFGARRLRSIAFERAIEGTLKGHYYHGERVGEERVYDNRLLTYLLGKTGHLLLDPPRECRAIFDNWEDHMDALEMGLEPEDLKPAPDDNVRPEFTGDELEEDDEGIWWTRFPPPEGFDGEEQGEYGDYGYKRTLSPREQAALDADLEQKLEEERAAEAARRDRYFGFAGAENSSPREAERSETSEAEDRGGGPIEYKSMTPPRPAVRFRLPSFRLKEPMNTEARSARRPSSWLPHQVQGDGRRPRHIQTARPRHPC